MVEHAALDGRGVFGAREAERDGGAGTDRGGDIQVAMVESRTLLHSEDAVAALPREGSDPGGRFKADAVVPNGDVEPVRGRVDGHFDHGGVRVLLDVAERFLGDSKSSQFLVSRELARFTTGVESNVQTGALAEVFREPFEGREEAEVIEHSRAEVASHATEVGDGIFGDGAQGACRGGDLVVVTEFGEDEVEATAEAGECLGGAIMQFAGEPESFVFLGVGDLLGVGGEDLPTDVVEFLVFETD